MIPFSDTEHNLIRIENYKKTIQKIGYSYTNMCN